MADPINFKWLTPLTPFHWNIRFLVARIASNFVGTDTAGKIKEAFS